MRHSTGQRSYASLILKLVVLISSCALSASAQTTSTPALTVIQSPTQSLMTASPGNEISPTTTTVTAQSTAAPAQPYNNSVQVIIEFSQISWINQFLDKTSQPYKALEHNVSKAVLGALTADGSRGKVEVLEFKPGSVLAFLNVSTYEVDDKVKTLLESKMKNGTIGDFSVAPTLFSGSLFVVELKVKADCNDSLDDKGFRAKASLLSAVENELPNSTATIKKITCPKPGNVTMVTMRVQIERPTTTNPDEELEQLKDAVKSGKVGNVSVIPDWQAYNPGEKLFTASFDLKVASDKKNTSAYLEAEIRKLFQNDTNFENATVEIKDNKTAIVKIRMKIAAPDEPKEALKPLQDSVQTGSVGSAQVNKGSYRAFVNPNTVTQRLFEVHFWQNVSNCDVSTVNDSRYQTAQQVATSFINKLKSYKYFIAARQKSLKCVDNNTNVYAVFVVYLKPDAPEGRGQLNRFLLLCKVDAAVYKRGLKVVDRTPSQPSKNPLYTHWACIKPTTVTVPTPTEITTTPTPTPLPVPKLYVKLKLGMTWGEFCSKLEHSLRQKIAWNLYDKNGARVSPDRIIFINVERNCNDPAKKDEQAEVWFYVSKKSGSKDLHRCLTLKAYRLFKMFLENGNTKHLGPDFEGKLIHVDLVGEDAPKYKTREDSGKLSTLAIILIAVAGAVGLLLLTMACCCLFCCGARRRRKNDDQSHKLHLVHIVDGDGTDGKGNKDKGKKKKGANENDGNDKDKDGKRKKDKDRNEKDDGDRVINYENNAYGTAKDDGYTELNSNTLKSAPVIVTSPAPVTDKTNEGKKLGQASDSASSTPGGSRRGSSSNDGEGQGGGGLRHIDPEFKDRERRRSSVHSLIDDEDIPLTHKTGTVGIVALALRNRNEKKKEAEFKNLDKDVPDEEVKYPASTQAKNRSPDVLPAPKTRVKLSSNPDYINANWIRDHQGKKCYIATQHPLHETAEDFWRMTWEQQADMVVMVNEEEKEKPAEFMDYLPKGEGSTKSFGSIDITVKQIVKKADYTLTVLNLAVSKKLASSREVSHMRFTSWKERAMPNVALFVGFVTATREVRRKKGDSRAPTIVHCSDGLGFSGVYVAVDIGIKSHEESKTSVVDVFELSKNLRRDRHGIVCSLDHYNFIYQALYEYTVNYDESAESEKL